MADEHQELTKAFSGMGGLGVEETALVSALGRWRKQPEKRSQFRRGFPGFFTPPAAAVGAGAIERCSDDYVRHLKTEFARFKNLMVLWAMHPWERDARWAHRALHKKHHPASVLVELACTRTADELLGARRAYHALYHRSLESPAKYFGEVIDGAFKEGADKQAKAALTRVVVSRSDADMEEIREAYLKQHGAKLVDAVAKNTHGHYRDALLAMIGK
ncbi:unnamed protein product [Triticum turgidum subsp. durum]|uniref:Annexin n=1 Tax=Triticum turgidum subsp. durum TaxID=4567 RepID=A0A9R0TBC3_TRITD|nr:unnamed protein product [Triticum turgidum subsp. durum]